MAGFPATIAAEEKAPTLVCGPPGSTVRAWASRVNEHSSKTLHVTRGRKQRKFMCEGTTGKKSQERPVKTYRIFERQRHEKNSRPTPVTRIFPGYRYHSKRNAAEGSGML